MSALDILRQEDVRYFDGRYSTGFVDQAELDHLIEAGIAEKYERDWITFVRLVEEHGDEA